LYVLPTNNTEPEEMLLRIPDVILVFLYAQLNIPPNGDLRSHKEGGMSRSAHEFELHGDTLAAPNLELHPATMRFTTPAAEKDFLRFRGSGKVAMAIAVFAVSIPTFGGVYLQTGLVSVALGFVVNLLGLVLEIGAVACQNPKTVDGQAARAMRQELIGALGYGLSALPWQGSAAQIARAKCGHFEEGDVDAFHRCVAQFDFLPLALSIMTVLIAPRLTFLVPINAAITAAYLLSVALSSLYFAPIDYVADAVVGIGYMIALVVAAWAKERRERVSFLTIVKLQQANAVIEQQHEASRVVLAAALPAPLLNDGALSAHGVSHHSMHATVAITDIYSFSAWSTWHLEIDVIFILHAVMAAYDKVVQDHQGVERAMTYGDSYVVCSGLLEPHREHADAVMQCAMELRTASYNLSQLIDHAQFNSRTSIFTGELRGTSIGTTSRRYAVTGPAFDAASDRIGLCERDGIIAGSYSPPQRSDELGVGDGTSAQLASLASLKAGSGDEQAFSAVWLKVTDDGASLSEEPRNLIADAVVPAVVITAFLAAVLAEHASPDPQRQHSNQPLGLGLLCAGFATAWVNVGALVVSQGKLPVAAATALKVVPPALTGYGLVLLQCYFAQPRIGFVVALGYLCRFDIAVSWLLQLLLVTISTVIPAMLFTIAHDGSDVVLLGQTFVGVPIGLVVHRYFTVRADCEHVVANAAAENNVARSDEQASTLRNLLSGLLPAHAMAMVGNTAAIAAADGEGPTHVQLWNGISLLQVKLHSGGHDVQAMWDSVHEAVGSGGLLELVQASGDTLLVGGPFFLGATEAEQVSAARHVLMFLRELAMLLRSTACTFTAVATSGTVYGSLIGAANLTFRLLGCAVRENDAIRAAAPRPIGAARNVAFASDSFRRQERNFVLQKSAVVQNAAMSIALAVSQTSNEHHNGSASTLAERSKAFGAEMMWRAAGLGKAQVAVINI
jgi:hypothetical protein